MLEVKQKRINASMFGMADQPIMLALGSDPYLEKGYVGALKAPLLGSEFSGGLGVTLSEGKVCVGIAIDNPSLEIDHGSVQDLVAAGINLRGAYNIASTDAYSRLADKVAKDLLKGEVAPTLKIQFGNFGERGCQPDQRPVTKVEILMSGEKTGHPLWTLDNY